MSLKRGNKILADLGVDVEKCIKDYTRRNLNRKPVKSFDGVMLDAIFPYIQKIDKHLADQVRESIMDHRITKNFCEVDKIYAQAERFIDPKLDTKSMMGMDAYEGAWKILRSMFPDPRKNQLKPLVLMDDTDVSNIFSNPDASAGYLAYPKHKRDVPDLIKNVALKIMEDYDQQVSIPAIALTRSQITDFIDEFGNISSKNIKYKTRLVMCVDASSVLIEQLYGQPLLDRIFKPQPQYAGGKNDSEIKDFLLRTCKGKRWVSLDYSKFDASIQGWLIKDIFSFLSEYFSNEHKIAFNWISHNFIYMQLLMPKGEIYDLKRGIKSGSFFTQMVGSLANLLMILTFFCAEFGTRKGTRIVDLQPVYNELYSTTFPGNPRYLTLMAMGDDNIFYTVHEVNMSRLSEYLKKQFAAFVTIDGEKGYDSGKVDENPHFLKRIWRFSGQYREALDMFVNLLHPERRRSYEGYSPWHILFGYYLTFEGTMRKYFPRSELLDLMEKSNGIDALADIKLRELPGSLRSQVMNYGVDRGKMVKSLKDEYYFHKLAG